MKNLTSRTEIVNYIRNGHFDGREWLWGGSVERFCGQFGHKPSEVSRRLRELEEEGVLRKSYAQVNGKGPHCVRYQSISMFPERIPQAVEVIPTSLFTS